MTKELPSTETLRQLLDYDPETGVFTRKSTGKIVSTLTSNGYIAIGIDRGLHKAHRLAFQWMGVTLGALHVDHIDGNRQNNAWCNLRKVTRQENQRNLSTDRRNTSGVTGVHRDRFKQRWKASIGSKSSRMHLGYHDTLLDAAAARKSAELRLGYHENHGRPALQAA